MFCSHKANNQNKTKQMGHNCLARKKPMKNPVIQISRSFSLLLALAVMSSLAVNAALERKRTAATVVPPSASYHEKTYAELSAQSAEMAMEHPLEGHPALDTPDFDVRSGQNGEVWFLGGPFGTHERSVSVPAGKALLFIILNAECSTLEPPDSGFHGDTEAEQRACAKFWADHILDVTCTVDGEAVENIADHRVSSPQFTFTAPTPWLFGETGGTGTSVVDGYYVLVEPLPKGAHIVQYSGRLLFTEAEDGFDAELLADMTYYINAD